MYNNFEKTCGCKSCYVYKRFEKEMNFPLRNVLERQPKNKRPNVKVF
jgi:hypothetical protein